MPNLGTRWQDPEHFQGAQRKEYLVNGCGQAASPSSKFHLSTIFVCACLSHLVLLCRLLEAVTAAFDCIV